MVRLAAVTVLALTAAARADAPADPPPEPAPVEPAPAEPAATEPEPTFTPPPVQVAPAHVPAKPKDTEEELPLDYTESYRGQILAADGAAVGLLILGIMSDNSGSRSSSTSMIELSIATYFIGAPLIHLVHDRGTHALGSIGLRIGLPIVGGFLGELTSKLGCADQDYCGNNDGGAALGVVLGIIAASVVDAAALAKGDPRPDGVQLTAAPVRDGRGMVVGLSGSF